MIPFTSRQGNVAINKLLDLFQNIYFSGINAFFSFTQLSFAFGVLFFTRNIKDSGYIKILLLSYSIVNCLTLLVYGILVLYHYKIIIPPYMMPLKLFFYEMWCRMLRSFSLSLIPYLTTYEYIFISESKVLFYIMCFTIILDIATFSISLLTFMLYIIFSTLFVKTERTQQISATDVNSVLNEECAICLETYLPDQLLLILACEHKFHKDCINHWFEFNQICPTCKKNQWIEIVIHDSQKIKF